MNINREKNKVFLLDEDGNDIAHVLFENIDPNTVLISSTRVDSKLRGQGIASQLMNAAYKTIKDQGYKAFISCSYAYDWFARHPEKQDILVNDLDNSIKEIKGCTL